MPEYETFEGGKLQEGVDIDLELIDRDTMERFHVRARVARIAARLPGAERLWARQGHLGDTQHQEEWWIRIQSREGEDDTGSEVQRRPPSPRERAGFLLRSLIKERQQQDETEAAPGAQKSEERREKGEGE